MTNEPLNDCLDDNEEVYAKPKTIQEKSKGIESHFAYSILSYPLGTIK